MDTPEPELLRNNLLNGVRALEYIDSRPASNQTSRETSVLARVTNQLNIESTPTDEGDDEDEFASSEGEPMDSLPRGPALPYSTLPTGVCYDGRMRFHTELDPPKDRSEYHPEDPRRIFWIFRTLCEAGLIDNKEFAVEPLVPNPLQALTSAACDQS